MTEDETSSARHPSLDLPSITRRTMVVAPAALLFSHAVHARERSTPAKTLKGQIVAGLTQEPTVFNPLMPRIETDQGLQFCIFNPLWRVEPDGTFIPELAVEVPTLENGGISPDGLLWRIRLRKGVKWHDGTEFTAEDVKYTLELVNNPSFKAYSRQGHALVRDITVHGTHEISWKVSKLYAPYLSLLTSTFIVPKHVLGKAADPNTAPFNSAPIGTGPFKWSKRVPGESITLVANADYFGEGPFVERIIFKYIPDLNVAYTQFKTGQIDYIGYQGIAPQFFKEAQTLPDRKIHVAQTSQVEGLVLNFGRPVFQDKSVRNAMYLGLNKKVLIDLVYYGIPVETESYLARSSWAFNPALPKHVYDLAAGNRLLDEAGWAKGADGVRSKAGLRLEFTIATVAGNPQREQILQLVQQDWQKLGIAVQLKTMPAAVIFGEYYTRSQFDCLLASSTYGTGADPDPTQRFSSAAIPAQGGSGTNFYQYKNPEVDRLLQVGQTTFKQAERKEAYQRLQALIREDLALLPICQPAQLEGTRTRLTGFRSNPNVSSNCWNMGSWRWSA